MDEMLASHPWRAYPQMDNKALLGIDNLKPSRDFPGGPVVKIRLCASNAGGTVGSLVRELRSHTWPKIKTDPGHV